MIGLVSISVYESLVIRIGGMLLWLGETVCVATLECSKVACIGCSSDPIHNRRSLDFYLYMWETSFLYTQRVILEVVP